MFRSLVPWRERSLFPVTDRSNRLFGRFEDEMADLMERFFGEENGGSTLPGVYLPKTDLVESEGNFEVTIDLPGLKPEEVTVEMKDGDLWVSGKHTEEKEEKEKTYHRIERRRGEFRRIISLPSAIKDEEVEARFENGVLKVVVPKREEAKAKTIEVKS